MRPFEVLDSAKTPHGADIVLRRRDQVYQIVVDGIELMSSRAHDSEEALARYACGDLARARSARVLIAGLGMGYTLRAALDILPPRARVDVAEVMPSVVQWNRGPLADLAGKPLSDPRVAVRVADVSRLIAPGARYHAILLDVDNGPHSLCLPGNGNLYGAAGLLRLRGSLIPGGVLAVWSSYRDSGFERRLRQAGFFAHSVRVSSRGNRKGPWSTIFLGTAPKRAVAPAQLHGLLEERGRDRTTTGVAVVKKAPVNLRLGPSLDQPIWAQAQLGDTLATLQPNVVPGWHRLCLDGSPVYASSQFIELTGTEHGACAR